MQSAAARMRPALSDGLEGPGLDQGAPQRGQESFRDPRKRFRVPFSTLEALLSVHLASSESSTSLGSSRVDQGCMPQVLLSGSAAVGVSPSRIRRPRRGVWGRGEKELLVAGVGRRAVFKSLGGGGLTVKIRDLGHRGRRGGPAIRCSPHMRQRLEGPSVAIGRPGEFSGSQ